MWWLAIRRGRSRRRVSRVACRLRDAARVVALRSRLLGRVLAGRGGMVSVALDAERVAERLVPWGERLGVAAVNGPSSVVVSGEAGALGEFLEACEGDGVWARRVAVDYASHSAAVEELREELVEELAGIEPVSCGVPFFSTATGGLLDTAQLDGGYWYRSLRERVRFEEAVRALAAGGERVRRGEPAPGVDRRGRRNARGSRSPGARRGAGVAAAR